MKNSKIAFTGGHFTTAIAVYDELKKRGYTNFLWIGHKYSMLQDKETSFEYKEVTKIGIKFYDLLAGKVYRHFSLLAIVSFFRIPIGFVQSFFLLLKEKPDIILSFGGYIALPVVISAKVLGIKIITHEQTTSIGLANKIISKFANEILVSWEESLQYFPKDKTILTGLPVRNDIYTNDRVLIDFNNHLPSILIMGGNQGSHTINEVIKEIVPEISDFNIIHICGSNTIHNDYDDLSQLSNKYHNYKVYKGIWGEDIGRALNQSSFVISRSGANTIYELALLKKRAILIPLEHAVNNEQYKNAKTLESIGIGSILEEKNLNKENLLNTIRDTEKKSDMANMTKDQLVINDAKERVANIIEQILTN